VEITEALGCGHEALRKEAKRLGLPHRNHVSSAQFAQLARPVTEGRDEEHVVRLMAKGGFPAQVEVRVRPGAYLLGFGPWARKINTNFYRCTGALTWPAVAPLEVLRGGDVR
jgi:hypothetical protein